MPDARQSADCCVHSIAHIYIYNIFHLFNIVLQVDAWLYQNIFIVWFGREVGMCASVLGESCLSIGCKFVVGGPSWEQKGWAVGKTNNSELQRQLHWKIINKTYYILKNI